MVSREVPKKGGAFESMAFGKRQESPDFSKELIKTMKQAAEQLNSAQTVGEAKFAALTIDLAFAVQWDFAAGVTVPIQLVMVGGSFDRNKTSTQSVKLTFGESSK